MSANPGSDVTAELLHAVEHQKTRDLFFVFEIHILPLLILPEESIISLSKNTFFDAGIKACKKISAYRANKEPEKMEEEKQR